MAPSTPPPPRSEAFAAFTIASTSSVVMSATMISIGVALILGLVASSGRPSDGLGC
jgi:hypothetical protein